MHFQNYALEAMSDRHAVMSQRTPVSLGDMATVTHKHMYYLVLCIMEIHTVYDRELTDKIVKEKELTTIMVTHNLRYAIEYGNRLLMLHQGETILDKKGKEKEEMCVEDVLKLFNEISIECGN